MKKIILFSVFCFLMTAAYSQGRQYAPTTTREGYVPILPNDATKFLDGTGLFSSSVTANNGLTATGNNVQLGGTLIQNTTIQANLKQLLIDTVLLFTTRSVSLANNTVSKIQLGAGAGIIQIGSLANDTTAFVQAFRGTGDYQVLMEALKGSATAFNYPEIRLKAVDSSVNIQAPHITINQDTTVNGTSIVINRLRQTSDVTSFFPIAINASGNVKKLTTYATTSTDVQVFNTAGTYTWTKPVGAKFVHVELMGGGGGAGSGRRRASGTNGSGGGGGGGGGAVVYDFVASSLGTTETVVVGAGGTGGAAQTVNSTNGNDGTDGDTTSFGTWLYAMPGSLGQGGQVGNSNNGSGASSFNVQVSQIGSNGGTGNFGTVGGNGSAVGQSSQGTGGGGGGGVNSSNTDFGGGSGGTIGAGSRISGLYAILTAGGAGGAAAGGNGVAGASYGVNILACGPGAGGGGGNAAGVGGNGADALGYGGGGGGGGASLNGSNSGKGGNGHDGIAIITTYF